MLRLNHSSIPLRSQISEPRGGSKARRRFVDGLVALQEAVTKHWDRPVAQERVLIILGRLIK